jgi:tetratricopeptide (TPR) repeat protein
MEKAIGKCEKVINRHTLKNNSNEVKKKPKFNKWIDENYMVIGRAYFYKRNYGRASETFQYVNRKFKDPESVITSNTWLARTYIQQGEYGKAIQALQRVEEENKELDDKLRADYRLVYADVYIRQGKLEKAVVELESAIKLIKKKKDKARPYFILAQINQELGKSSDALTNYESVIKSRPTYELEFYSRINKALAYSRTGGSSAEIQKELFKMLKDDRNITYRDKIYHALGDIALEEQRREDAIGFYEKSLEANQNNPKQRAKTFLRLADLYFDERQYKPAQAYYDSTLAKIEVSHERYEVVKTRAENLTELINNLAKIELNDSLSTICKLSPVEREKRLADIQKQIERSKEEERKRDMEAAIKSNTTAVAAINGTFWAYNQNLRTSGKTNFADRWGDRPLKDNWRLSSKLLSSNEPGEEVTEKSRQTENPADSASTVDAKYKAPSVDELRSKLPCDDAKKMDQMAKDAAEGYYLAGVVYKEKLNDEDNAITTWEELLANVENSDFHPTTHYQLYRTWFSKESSKGYVKNPLCSQCNSKYWADEIKRKYPESDWAYLVDNPDYADMKDIKEQNENKAYEIAYTKYLDRNYYDLKTLCDSVIFNQPDNHLVCKYRLLRAISVGHIEAPFAEKVNYQNELNELVTKCAGSDEAKRADELLKAIKNNNKPITEDKTDESNGIDNQVKKDPPPAVDSTLVTNDNPFKYDAKAEHYLALIMPVVGSDINKTKMAISDFNAAMFTSAMLKVTNNLLNKDQHLVLVKSFKVLTEGENYIATFNGDNDKLKDINNGNNISFLISKQNYITLFKSKDIAKYLEFYSTNYN